MGSLLSGLQMRRSLVHAKTNIVTTPACPPDRLRAQTKEKHYFFYLPSVFEEQLDYLILELLTGQGDPNALSLSTRVVGVCVAHIALSVGVCYVSPQQECACPDHWGSRPAICKNQRRNL